MAVKKLQRWLCSSRKSQVWLASTCGVKPPSVHAWMARQTRPVAYLREVIEAATGGVVQCADWEFPSEREKRDQAIRQIQADAEDELSGDAA